MRECGDLWVQLEGSCMVKQGDWALSMRNGRDPGGATVSGSGASLLWSGRNGVSKAEGAALMAAWGRAGEVETGPDHDTDAAGMQQGCSRSSSSSSSSSCSGRGSDLDTDRADTPRAAARGVIASKEEAMHAVQVDGRRLRICSATLRADREVCLAAVSSYGKALKFAGAALRADEGLAEVAVRQEGIALQYVSEDLRHRCWQGWTAGAGLRLCFFLGPLPVCASALLWLRLCMSVHVCARVLARRCSCLLPGLVSQTF